MTMLSKTSAAALRWAVDWGVRAPVAARWSASPDGLTLADEGDGGRVSRVRLAGGVPGATYRVTARATFAGGEERSRSLTIAVGAR